MECFREGQSMNNRIRFIMHSEKQILFIYRLRIVQWGQGIGAPRVRTTITFPTDSLNLGVGRPAWFQGRGKSERPIQLEVGSPVPSYKYAYPPHRLEQVDPSIVKHGLP